MKTFEQFMAEGKTQPGRGKISNYPVDFDSFDGQVKKDLKKHKLTWKTTNKQNSNGSETVHITGLKSDILAYMMSDNYSGGLDMEDFKETDPRLFK